MAKVPVGKGGRGAGGALPEETRAILGATTNAGKAARSGLGGLLANAGDEARGFWQALQTPMGAANLATGFLGRFAVPAQVVLEAARDPNALVESPETAIPGAVLRSQTPVGLFEQSPGWNQFAQGARQQVTETLTAPGEVLKPGGVGRISKRSARNLVKMLKGIRQGFYDAPVASTLGMVAPALHMASAHAPVTGDVPDNVLGATRKSRTPLYSAADDAEYANLAERFSGGEAQAAEKARLLVDRAETEARLSWAGNKKVASMLSKKLAQLGVPHKMEKSSGGSVYITLIDEHGSALRKIRVADHAAPAGGGFNQKTGDRFGDADIDLNPTTGVTVDDAAAASKRLYEIEMSDFGPEGFDRYSREVSHVLGPFSEAVSRSHGFRGLPEIFTYRSDGTLIPLGERYRLMVK